MPSRRIERVAEEMHPRFRLSVLKSQGRRQDGRTPQACRSAAWLSSLHARNAGVVLHASRMCLRLWARAQSPCRSAAAALVLRARHQWASELEMQLAVLFTLVQSIRLVNSQMSSLEQMLFLELVNAQTLVNARSIVVGSTAPMSRDSRRNISLSE